MEACVKGTWEHGNRETWGTGNMGAWVHGDWGEGGENGEGGEKGEGEEGGGGREGGRDHVGSPGDDPSYLLWPRCAAKHCAPPRKMETGKKKDAGTYMLHTCIQVSYDDDERWMAP